MKEYIKILKKLNKKALKNGDVPVSALIIYDNKIISKAYNMREKKKNVLYHAEILAIINACKKMKSWNLNGCVLISTLKPCNMCFEVIKSAKINTVYYILDNKKTVNYQINCIKYDTEDYKCFHDEIIDFFRDKR